MIAITKKQINEETRVARQSLNSFAFNFDFEGRSFEANRNLPGTMEVKETGELVCCGSGDTKKEFINSVYEAINEI